MEYKIAIKNIDSIYAMFKVAPLKMTQEVDKAIRRSILIIESEAKREAPVNKQTGGGNLRQSIRSQMVGIARGMIEAEASYASAVETGTDPHVITIKNKRVLANRRTGQIFGRIVRHPGTKENPFMLRALNNSETRVDELFNKAVQNVLK